MEVATDAVAVELESVEEELMMVGMMHQVLMLSMVEVVE